MIGILEPRQDIPWLDPTLKDSTEFQLRTLWGYGPAVHTLTSPLSEQITPISVPCLVSLSFIRDSFRLFDWKNGSDRVWGVRDSSICCFIPQLAVTAREGPG